jgi:molybdopterin synthase catalytic subunit
MDASGRPSLWKKEVYAGGEEWVGSEAQYQAEVGRGDAPPDRG